MKITQGRLTKEETEDLNVLEEIVSSGQPLTEEGKKTLLGLRRKAAPPMGAMKRVVTGIGRGLMDTYQGAEQIARQVDEKIGITKPGTTDAYTREKNKEIEQWNQFQEMYPGSTIPGRFVGNAASVPIPGAQGGLPARLAYNALAGAGIGATQYDPTGGSQRAGNAAWGAGGSMVGDLLFSGGQRAIRGLFGGNGLPPLNPVAPYVNRGTTPHGPPPSIAASIAQDAAPSAPPKSYRFWDHEQGIPYTEGQHTGDLGRQQIEQRIAHGAFGEGAEQDLVGTWDYQRARIDNRYRDIESDIIQGPREGQMVAPGSRGGRELGSEAEAGAAFRGGIKGRADRLWSDTDEAWKIARESKAELSIDDSRQVVSRVTDSLDVYDLQTPEINPSTHLVIDRLNSFIPETVQGQAPTGMDAQALHSMRRLISDELSNSTIKNADARNLRIMRNTLDQSLLDIADSGRLRGNPEGIHAMRQGIKLRADYGRLYGPNYRRLRSGRNLQDPAGKAIERIIETDMSGEDVAKLVFGKQRLGSTNLLPEMLSRVERVVGRNAPEYQSLRNIALERMRRTVLQAGTDSISPQKLRTEWMRLRKTNPGLLDQLFSRKELEDIGKFVDASSRTIYNERATNPSKTAHMLESIFKGMPAVTGAVVGGSQMGAYGAMGGAFAAHALANMGDTVKDIMGGVFATRVYQGTGRSLPPSIGAAAGQDVRERMQ